MATNSTSSSAGTPSFGGKVVATPAVSGAMDTDGEGGTIARVASSSEDQRSSRPTQRQRERRNNGVVIETEIETEIENRNRAGEVKEGVH